MLDSNKTFREVCGLLERLSFVKVVRDELNGDIAEISLTVGSGVAMAALQRSCLGANIGITPLVRLSEVEERAEIITPVTCTLSANARSLDEIDGGYLQLLGIHLVWHLHEAGKFSPSEANEFLDRWNGARVAT